MKVKFERGVVYIDNRAVGNVRDHILREGSYTSPGSGTPVGNVKNGIIYEGRYTSPGSGTPIGNVKNGYVFSGRYTSPGSGNRVGKVEEFVIPGTEREYDEEIVAIFHFFIKKFL